MSGSRKAVNQDIQVYVLATKGRVITDLLDIGWLEPAYPSFNKYNPEIMQADAVSLWREIIKSNKSSDSEAIAVLIEKDQLFIETEECLNVSAFSGIITKVGDRVLFLPTHLFTELKKVITRTVLRPSVQKIASRSFPQTLIYILQWTEASSSLRCDRCECSNN